MSFALSQWGYADTADARYKRIMRRVWITYLILAILIPFLKLSGVQQGGGDNGKQRTAKLVQQAPPAAVEESPPPAEKPTPEPPKQEVKPKPEPKKEVKPEPTPQPTQEQLTQRARQVAQHSGLLAMQEQLSDLRDRKLSSIEGTRALTSAESAGGAQEISNDPSQAFSASAAQASGGITTSNANGHRQSGTRLDARKTTVVQSPVGFGQDKTKPGQGGDKLIASRTLEEIQLGFDRAKSAWYALFSRYEREHGELPAGTLIVSLTIAPDGSVTECHIVSSPYGAPELEEKFVQRIKLLNFGAKDVPSFTYPNYPFRYLPSG